MQSPTLAMFSTSIIEWFFYHCKFRNPSNFWSISNRVFFPFFNKKYHAMFLVKIFSLFIMFLFSSFWFWTWNFKNQYWRRVLVGAAVSIGGSYENTYGGHLFWHNPNLNQQGLTAFLKFKSIINAVFVGTDKTFSYLSQHVTISEIPCFESCFQWLLLSFNKVSRQSFEIIDTIIRSGVLLNLCTDALLRVLKYAFEVVSS